MSTGEFWPEKGIIKCDWELKRRQSNPFALSGDSVPVDRGEPYWIMDVTVAAQKGSALARSWSSFMMRREGMGVSFTANRVFQSFPAHRTITSDAGLSVASVSRANAQVQFSGTNDDLSSESDMIGFYTAAGGYWIGVVVSKASDTLLNVKPAPFPAHATLANPRRIKAVGEFRMDDVYAPKESYNSWSLSFQATQVIRG